MIFLLEFEDLEYMPEGYTVELFSSILMPLYKDNKRVQTYKLDVTMAENGGVEFAELLSKSAEIGEYKREKYLVSKEMRNLKSMQKCLLDACKKQAKKLKLATFAEENSLMSIVNSYAIYNEDDDNCEKSYLSVHGVSKVSDPSNLIHFAVLVSEDSFIIREFLSLATSVKQVENVIMDIEDSFSVLKALDVDPYDTFDKIAKIQAEEESKNVQ